MTGNELKQILSGEAVPVTVHVGQARLTATAHATRRTRVGDQVLVSLSGRLIWVSAHRVEWVAADEDDLDRPHRQSV